MKKAGYTIGTLIILLICAFVFVLVPAMAGSGNQQEAPSFGSYNNKQIRYEQNSDMANFVSQYGQYYQSMGMQIDQSNYYYIYNNAFNATVAKMAAEDSVAKSGYKVPKAAVTRQMLPYFSDENGNYNSKAYRSTPESTIAQMRSDIESSLVSLRFNDDNFGSDNGMFGLKASTAELDFLAKMNEGKRGFDMAAFPLAGYPDSEKAAFGKANASKFIKYDMSVITVEDEATAKKVLKRLDAEEVTFADAVAEYSEKNYSNSEGKLTSNYAYQIENIMNDSAEVAVIGALKAGEKSGIVKTKFGYSIFMADGDSVAPDFESEDMLKTVNSYLNSYESSVIENYFIAEAKDFIAEAAMDGFDAACAKHGIEKDIVAPFPLNYGNSSIAGTLNTNVPGLANAATNENFLNTAFSLKMNEVSEPLVLDGNVIVLKYTTDGETAEEEASLPDTSSFDESSASSAIMNSPKLVNNFTSTYFENFLN